MANVRDILVQKVLHWTVQRVLPFNEEVYYEDGYRTIYGPHEHDEAIEFNPLDKLDHIFVVLQHMTPAQRQTFYIAVQEERNKLPERYRKASFDEWFYSFNHPALFLSRILVEVVEKF